MMCAATNRSFRTQLSAILEKLTKAALVEISSLADECSSVLRTEITQHKSENEALKKKCYSLEIQLMAAREAQHLNNGSRRQVGGQGAEDGRGQQQQQPAPAIDGVFGKDWCMDLWREDKLPSQRKEAAACAARDMGPQAIDLIDGEPDLIFVKEETYDEQPVGQQMRLAGNRKGVGVFGGAGAIHGAANDLRLVDGFPMTAGSPAQQGTQPTLMDNLIEDATLSNLVDNANPASATGEYSDFMNNATKEAAFQPRPMKPTKQFECLFCGKIFNYLSSLKVHIRRHSGEKPFSCTVCGKRFAQKTYLKLHQRVHSGEKPYTCPECGRSFSQKSSLNIHRRTHTGEKPYSCVDCGKSYAYKYGFNQHQCFS